MSIVVFLTQNGTLTVEIFRKNSETVVDPCGFKQGIKHEQIKIGMYFFNEEAIQFIFIDLYLFLDQF